MRKYSILCLLALVSCSGKIRQQSSSVQNINPKTVRVITTAENTQFRLSPTAVLDFEDFGQPLETQPCVFIDPSKTYQTLVGIGAAFTDASAETFAKLPKNKQQEFLTAYFDKEKGIGYSLGRTHINSCDFSSGSYTYVEDNDAELKTSNISHDEKYRIPFIKQAIAAAGGKLPLYVSP